MNKFVIATRNQHKLVEIKKVLSDIPIQLIGMNDFHDIPEIEETGTTLVENSLIKARMVYQFTQLPTIGDDTGLEVDYLNGAPGVSSARYAGPDSDSKKNVEKLLNELKDVPLEHRTARFRTVISIVYKGGENWIEGIAEGIILKKQKGNRGFGYDPIFYYPPFKKTFAELSLDEKNKISHRGLALQKFRILLGQIDLNEQK
jgi:XTP/dITP diphosphohydrolase